MGQHQDTAVEEIGSVPRCQTCQSERVVKEARACWNRETGLWELEEVLERAFCRACETQTILVWCRPETPPQGRIQELNDRFRKEGLGKGSVMITPGLQALGDVVVVEVIKAVRAFDDFSDDSDPWGERDFGAIEIAGEKIFWKLDYYDPTLTLGSENPANEALTHRVLTIMLASEY